jgi:hypothetical protein
MFGSSRHGRCGQHLTIRDGQFLRKAVRPGASSAENNELTASESTNSSSLLSTRVYGVTVNPCANLKPSDICRLNGIPRARMPARSRPWSDAGPAISGTPTTPGHAKHVVAAVGIDTAGIAVDDHQPAVALMDTGAAALDATFSFWPARQVSVAASRTSVATAAAGRIMAVSPQQNEIGVSQRRPGDNDRAGRGCEWGCPPSGLEGSWASWKCRSALARLLDGKNTGSFVLNFLRRVCLILIEAFDK